MTPRQRRYIAALWLVVVLAIGAALSSGLVALAFGVASVGVIARATWSKIRRSRRTL